MGSDSMVMTYIGQMPVGTSSSQPPPAIGSLAVFSDEGGTVIRMFDGKDWTEVTDRGFPIDMKKLSCDTVSFGSSTFYTVEPQGYDWSEIHDWVTENFGSPRIGPGQSDAKWFVSAGVFFFHDVKNRDWLVMRWSS